MNQEKSLHLLIVLSRAYKSIMEQAEKDIRSYGLNPTEFAVLELLYHKGSHPLQQIGDKILLSSGSMTYVIDKLEKKGYLERVACPKDRRVIYGNITENGNRLMDDIFPKHAARITESMQGLSDEEKEICAALLIKLGKSAG